MIRLRWLCLLAALSLVVALPSAASARGGGDRADDAGDVPARVAKRIKRANRALDRAEERIDDGETAKAVSQLAANRRNLNAALKAAKRRDADALDAVIDAQHETVSTVLSLFDGQSGEVVDALGATLDNAITGRDDAIASGGTAYAEDVAEERADLAEAVEDDELTTEAQAHLADADAKLAATETAAEASEADDESDEDGFDGERGDCPERGEGDDAPAREGERAPR